MYHQFVPIKSEVSLNNELHKLISYYNTQLESKLGLVYTPKSIHVDMVVDNFKHNTRLYILSNGKVLRYENKTRSVCQVEGLECEDIIQMKALQIGEEERYVLMTEDGVSVCTIRGDEIRVKVVQLLKEQQKMQQQQQQPASKPITISTLHCELTGSVFIQQPPNNENEVNNENQNEHEQQQQQQQYQKNLNKCTKDRQMFIVNRGSNSQFDEIRDDEFALVVVVSERDTVRKLAVYRVDLRMAKMKDKVDKPTQQCSIHPILLPNNTYSIQLLITDSLNQTQLKDANFEFSKSHPILKADHQICLQTNSFSIYFATQAILCWVEPHEWRHHVFEFQFCLDDGEKVDALTVLLGQKKVLTPCRVYSLPLCSESTILRYFTIKKTLHQESQSPTYSNSLLTKEKAQSQNPIIETTIKITIVFNQSIQNQTNFIQTQLKITKGNNKQSLFVINQQNLSFFTIIRPKFVLRDVLLLDCMKKYAILLVNENGLRINWNDNKENNCQRLIIVNLSPNILQTNRIVSEFQINCPYNDTICNVSLLIPPQRLSSSLINKSKQVEVTYSQITDNQISSKLVELVPKAEIYLKMLDNVLPINQNCQEFSKESFINSVIHLLSI